MKDNDAIDGNKPLFLQFPYDRDENWPKKINDYIHELIDEYFSRNKLYNKEIYAKYISPDLNENFFAIKVNRIGCLLTDKFYCRISLIPCIYVEE